MALRLLSKRVTSQPLKKNLVTPRPAVPLVCVRCIAGKNLYTPDPNKPPPYDAFQHNFHIRNMLFDKTTLRFDENSKLIVVEGAHGIGKDKFCKELAEELSMGYVKAACMDDLYINQYGFDLRQLDNILPEALRTFDEKDFSKNPLGPIKGGTDRMFYHLFLLKMINYFHSLKHIFNTGQGIVMDGSIYSDHIYANAALRQGWIDPTTHYTLINLQRRTLPQLLRPNLIIYLDAPVDVVQRNIQTNGNEWEKNSPVWTNKNYLTDIYNEFKNTYLRKASTHSRVLVYDWSEGGEAEIVVEDIENLEMDNLPRYDNQQKDWRLVNEELSAHHRYRFANHEELRSVINSIINGLDYYDAEHLWTKASDFMEMAEIFYWTESHRYSVGFNEKLNDPPNPFEISDYRAAINQNIYPNVRRYRARPTYAFEEDEDGIDYEAVKKVIEANGGRRPVNHNRELLKY